MKLFSLLVLLAIGFVASTELNVLEISKTLLLEWNSRNNEKAFQHSFIDAFKLHRTTEMMKLESPNFLEDSVTFAYFFICSLVPKLKNLDELMITFASENKMTVPQLAEQVVRQKTSHVQTVIDDMLKIQYLCLCSLEAAYILPYNGVLVLNSSRIGNFTLKVIAGAFKESLTGLILCDNQISDLSPLTALYNLQELSLRGNLIKDLSPIASLSKLLELNLSNNKITDTSPLASLSDIRVLLLGKNEITDISFVASFPKLFLVDLSENQITDVSKLAHLSKLSTLNLNQNLISDFSVVSTLNALGTVQLRQNRIVNIPKLDSLYNLHSLDLGNNQIIDISNLTYLSTLQWLNLGSNQITDISHLAYLSRLRSVNISENPIEKFVAIDSFPDLVEVIADMETDDEEEFQQ